MTAVHIPFPPTWFQKLAIVLKCAAGIAAIACILFLLFTWLDCAGTNIQIGFFVVVFLLLCWWLVLPVLRKGES